uniref:Type IV / VI secretion system protein, DotU family n=1 Tax=Candidatus Kentrum sp. DK TaxID=2126562 RepID=A0A450TDP2_9GAMM|nr:MAG: type IV / VI secretion system protein, DotU family [Candidatus Kentron sp. DK]
MARDDDASSLEHDLVGNPLLNEAVEILAAVNRLSPLPAHDDVPDLSAFFADALKRFKARLLAIGIAGKTTERAFYVLAGFVDDVLFNSPWGKKSWQSLAIPLGNDELLYAGEEIFSLLDEAERDADHDLLELIYVCLSLGFIGKYVDRIEDLHRKRRRIYESIAGRRRSVGGELSPRWRAETTKTRSMTRYAPLRVVVAIAVAVLAALYLIYAVAIHDLMEPECQQLQSLAREAPSREIPIFRRPGDVAPLSAQTLPPPSPPAEPVPAPAAPLPASVLLTFGFDKLELSDNDIALLKEVAAQLAADPALAIRILGRTDHDVSAWKVNDQLSKTRARIVCNHLVSKEKVLPERIWEVRGIRDTNPIGDRKEYGYKAMNRSAEIIYVRDDDFRVDQAVATTHADPCIPKGM